MQVEAYLEAFANAFDLHQYIRYQTRVVSLMPLRLPSASGHALSNGALASAEAQNGSPQSLTNGTEAPRGDAEVAPPRWRISTEPAETQVGYFLSHDSLGPHAQCAAHAQEPTPARVQLHMYTECCWSAHAAGLQPFLLRLSPRL